MSDSLPRVLICGTVRNGGRRLEKTVHQLSKVFGVRFRVDFYVVESDSTDSTLSILQALNDDVSSFKFLSLGPLRNETPDRLERISRCRNVYMEYFDLVADDYEFLVTADMDGVNLGLRSSSLDFMDDANLEWGAACANQRGPYYDIGALRARGWNETDPFRKLQTLTAAGMPFPIAQKIAVESKMVSIPTDMSPFEVESAYGGLVVYEARHARGCRYSTGPQGEVEIVDFNRQFSKKSRKPILLVPSFSNSRYTEHTAQFSAVGRLIYGSTKVLRHWLKKLVPADLIERLSEMERRAIGR